MIQKILSCNIKNISKIFFYALILLFSSTQFIFAAEGDLDTTFNPSGTPPGTVQTLIGTSAQANSMAIQADGKIVAAGFATVGVVQQFAVARYNIDGSLDSSFGSGGIVVTVIGTFSTANSIAIQADGKIVAAGFATVGGLTQFAVVRYNTDGSLDSTFGSGGIVLTSINLGFGAQAYSVAIQSDGKIVVAGLTGAAGGSQIAVVRYNTDGSLDSTFGSGGIVKTSINIGAQAYSVAIQSDGKIVVGGFTILSGGEFITVVVRYNADGSLDTTFGSGGIVQTGINGIGDDIIFSVAIQSDGKIVAAGFSDTGAGNEIVVIRYNTDGSLDSTFGSGGIVVTSIGTFVQALSVAIQSDGKIVAAGRAIVGGVGQFAVVRYNTDGSLDSSFGSGGIVLTVIGADSLARSVAIQSDGKIVAAGTATAGGAIFKFALARYLANTTLIQSALTIAIKNKYCGNGA